MVHGLDRLTVFLGQAHVPTPEIERAWRRWPRDGSTRSRGWGSRPPTSRRSGSRPGRPSRQLSNTCNLFRGRAVPELGDAIATPR